MNKKPSFPILTHLRPGLFTFSSDVLHTHNPYDFVTPYLGYHGKWCCPKTLKPRVFWKRHSDVVISRRRTQSFFLVALKHHFGIKGRALVWFQSYRWKRSQHVAFGDGISDTFQLTGGVLKDSCLGTLLVTLYASKLF